MFFAYLITILFLLAVALFFRNRLMHGKSFYSIVSESDVNGNTIFKLYIASVRGGRQYIGKFDTIDAAKAKIVALKEKAAKDAENLLKMQMKAEVYREDM